MNMARRVETRASLTAELTCICRAGSSVERNEYYKSEDNVALQILPNPIKTLIQNPFYRKLHFGFGAPKGLYEYIIVRTKYIDNIYKMAIDNKIVQIIILGAGYDTRAIRLNKNSKQIKIFELDTIFTQNAKLNLYKKNNIAIPNNLYFAAINFEKEELSNKFDEIGIVMNKKSLYIIEGVTMYLKPEAVDKLFNNISKYMDKGSIVVFDYIYRDILRQEKKHYGEKGTNATVKRANESFQFGLEANAIGDYMNKFHLKVIDHLDAKEMEKRYFTDKKGKIIHPINDIHCLATIQKI
jgi:methyltransferase (TIGR00027 family)